MIFAAVMRPKHSAPPCSCRSIRAVIDKLL